MFRFTKKRVAVGVTAIAALALAAGAYAYFTSTGSGTGSASVGTSTTWAVSTTGGTVHNDTALTPQASACGSDTATQLAASTCVYETVPYSVKNNSTGYQKLQNVAISVANSDGTAWTAVTGCSKSDFSVDGAGTGSTANDTAQSSNLAPGATANGTLTIVMVDSGSSQDGCKNANVPLYLSAS